MRRANQLADVLQATTKDCEERIVPSLAALLDGDRNRDIQSACLIALGKVGIDGQGVDTQAIIAERLKRDDQEVRESAVLAVARDRCVRGASEPTT